MNRLILIRIYKNKYQLKHFFLKKHIYIYNILKQISVIVWSEAEHSNDRTTMFILAVRQVWPGLTGIPGLSWVRRLLSCRRRGRRRGL